MSSILTVVPTNELGTGLTEDRLDRLSLEELASRANDAADEFDSSASNAVEAAVRCGMALTAVKTRLPHGEWLPWLKEHFKKDSGTARRYIRLAAYWARMPNLHGANSINKAIQMAAASDEISEETREEKKQLAIQKLLQGEHKNSVAKELGLSKQLVSKIFDEEVVPEQCKIDWKSQVMTSRNRAMEAAKLRDVIVCHMRANGETGGTGTYVCKYIPIKKWEFDYAVTIRRRGCPFLIGRVERNAIAISTAHDLCAKSHEEQMESLQTMEENEKNSIDHHLRFTIGKRRDYEIDWNQKYGDDFSILQQVDPGKLALLYDEIDSVMKSSEKWNDRLRHKMESILCLKNSTSQPTNEP